MSDVNPPQVVEQSVEEILDAAPVADLLSYLRVISTIRPGEKFYTKSKKVHPVSLLDVFWRWGEKREDTIEFLIALFKISVAHLKKAHDKSANTAESPAEPRPVTADCLASQFAMTIRDALKGVNALMSTYSADHLTVARLQTLADSTVLKVKTIGKFTEFL